MIKHIIENGMLIHKSAAPEIKLDKKLSEAQQKDYDEESALIRDNTKRPNPRTSLRPQNGHIRMGTRAAFIAVTRSG